MSNIKKIIDKWDPMDLFPPAPKDEYKQEILDIEKACLEINESELLAREIYNIFKGSFNSAFIKTIDECEEIAIQIL